MLVYLVRHAESLTNAGQSASLNPGLSRLGLAQSDAVARRFAGIELSAIYSSPFRRCLDSVAPLAVTRPVPIRIRPELHECYYAAKGSTRDTELEGWDQITQSRPSVQLCEDWRGPVTWPPVDESGPDLFHRMRSFAEYLKNRWGATDESVLVVSHGSPLAKLVDAWLSDAPGPSYRYVIDNCGVSALRFSAGRSTLVCLNELTHLAGLPAPEIANYLSGGVIKPRQPPIQ